MDNKYTFCMKTIYTWQECNTLLHDRLGWVFRGQSNSDWKLQTSLERKISEKNDECLDIREIILKENEIIDKFKRRAFNYIRNLPADGDLLEWLSLMQHHGAPTRLLDFSYSYYIALYFATHGATKDSALYCINKKIIDEINKNDDRFKQNLSTDNEIHSFCNMVLKEQTMSPSVMLIEPYYMHERLFRQQGLFAIPFEGRQSFEYNLSLTEDRFRKDLPEFYCLDNEGISSELINQKCILMKIIIPKSIHNDIRHELKLMNITSETLFPGIDGMAMALGD
ncbi:FRG domain-containing protein [Clostridium sp. AN503]|uniref:FRG domain-containing protein n=1 Tax=Clostridium sp. AN503 TaxID=3160598 RepID=UPI00345934F0